MLDKTAGKLFYCRLLHAKIVFSGIYPIFTCYPFTFSNLSDWASSPGLSHRNLPVTKKNHNLQPILFLNSNS